MTSLASAVPPPAVSAPRRTPWRALAVWLVAVSAVSLCVAVPYMVVSAFRLERDASRLRDSVTGAFSAGSEPGWSRIVEVSVGRGTFGLARFVTQFTPVPPEARQALRAARSASVGVYQWRGADLAAMRSRMAGAPTEIRVGGRDWTRVVTVRDGGESVVVLTPSDASEGDLVELCVLVLADEHLVVVNARVDPEPLSDLVQPRLRELSRDLHHSI